MESSLVVRLFAGLPERIARAFNCCWLPCPIRKPSNATSNASCRNPPPHSTALSSSAGALRCAVNVFSYSRFLSDAVLKNPERILQVSNSGSFYRALSVEGYEERLFDFLGKERRDMPSALDLARFRRRQLLRICLRDVMGVAALAGGHRGAFQPGRCDFGLHLPRIRARLVAQHGEPRLADGSVCGFSVISLGKLGGKELNYSSDIDLMFVYGGNGETDGPSRITNKEFCKKIANEYTALLSTYTADGQCYRVDLRLRPDGTLGEICISDEGARTYYADRARDWEKQMLIKARVSAGEPEPGAALLEFVSR
jgi:glutamate-ammonia-ligase adenylyltransferase